MNDDDELFNFPEPKEVPGSRVYCFRIEELTLLYEFLRHEYIRNLELRKVVDRIAKIVESYHA